MALLPAGKAVAAMLFLILVASCGGAPAVPTPPPGDAPAALRAAQKALDRAGGYRLVIEQSNFVLPQWGGSDSGTVTISADGLMAQASLNRTGESDATYSLTLVDGTTYFKRSSCNQAFRVPGGGADVLGVYLFGRTHAFANAHDAVFENGLVRATMDGIGSVTISLDSKTSLPQELRGTVNGRDLIWKFESWGIKPDASAPKGVQDRGPGGIPC